MSYRVSRVDLAAAGEILPDLWRSCLGLKRDPFAKFRWGYLESPHGQGRAFLLIHQKDTGPIDYVGCAGAEQRTFYRNGRPLRASLLVDFATNTQHRTGFPALVLQRGVRAHCREQTDFAYGFPSRGATAIFTRVGYHELGKMAGFVRVFRYAPYLHSALRIPLLPEVGGWILDSVTHRSVEHQARQASTSSRIDWVRDVDSRFDTLWQEAHRGYGMLCHRGAEFVRWRFLQQPSSRYDLAILVERNTGQLRAYAAIQAGGKTAHIADLFGLGPTDLGLLLDLVIPELERRGFAAASMHFLGASWMHALLTSRGFRFRSAVDPVFVDPGGALLTHGEQLPSVEEWYLTDADRD
jgi:hypothetical protein